MFHSIFTVWRKKSVFYVEIRLDFMELQHVPQTAHKQMMTVLARVYVDIRVSKQSVMRLLLKVNSNIMLVSRQMHSSV